MSTSNARSDAVARPSHATSSATWQAWIPYGLILLFALPLILFGLDRYSLVNGDEEIYHVVARHMLESGDWIRLQFYDEHRVYDTFMNAPLQYWARAATIAVLGDSLFSMRILSALFAVASLFATCRLAEYVTGSLRLGLLAAAVQLTTFQFVYLHGARTGELEPVVLLLFTILALQFIRGIEEERSFVLHHVCLVLLFNVKSPTLLIPLLAEIACFAALPWARPAWSRFFRTAVWILPFAAVWHIARIFSLYEPFLAVMSEMAQQATAHAAGREAGGRLDTLGFYLRTIFFGALPWSIIFPFALLHGLRPSPGGVTSNVVSDDERRRRRFQILALFVAAVFVFYAIVSKHHRWYIMPIYPLLSIFVAQWLADLPGARWTRWRAASLALIVASLAFTKVNLAFNPFAMKSYLIPMHVYARAPFGIPSWIGLPLLAIVLWASLHGMRDKLPARLREGLGVALATALLLFALYRVSAPLRHIDHQSEMAALRSELDALEAAGALPAFPIEPSISLSWDARYTLGDRYVITPKPKGRFTLMPRPTPQPLSR